VLEARRNAFMIAPLHPEGAPAKIRRSGMFPVLRMGVAADHRASLGCLMADLYRCRLGCGNGTDPGNFGLPLSAMRTTIIAYTSGEGCERQKGVRDPKKPLSSVERDNGRLCPQSRYCPTDPSRLSWVASSCSDRLSGMIKPIPDIRGPPTEASSNY
jgi:hypothetical protein